MTKKEQPLRFEYRDASELDENPANWRIHNDQQLDALKGALDQVGWAGALLYNERTKRLIDGHARKKISTGKVPVLIGSWTEEEEKVILATLDPLAAMATANTDALAKLLENVGTKGEALAEMLKGLAEENGSFDVASGDMPSLPDGDREPIQQMTFTLSDDQAADVKSAIVAARNGGPFVDTGNENSNGNALARIVEAYLGTC